MQIVDRIRAKCKEKGTTMGTLEKELGYGNGNIRRWDEKEPGVKRVYEVANILGVSVEYLLTGKEAADLTPEEQEIIKCYRDSNEQGKRTIMTIAQSQKQENTLSVSKIG